MNHRILILLILLAGTALSYLIFGNLFWNSGDPSYLRQPIGTLVD